MRLRVSSAAEEKKRHSAQAAIFMPMLGSAAMVVLLEISIREAR
jgi:hypothetical protein